MNSAQNAADAAAFRVHLPSGESFPCRPDESVLEAMRRAGGPIRCGCFGGGCGVCRMRVTSGTYHRFHRMSRAHVSAKDEHNGIVLLCCIRPLSDLTIEPACDQTI